jgi:hypothetical protein
LPNNSPRRLFSISSTQTSNTMTEAWELQIETSWASPSYQTWVCTKCKLMKKALAAIAATLNRCKPVVYLERLRWA